MFQSENDLLANLIVLTPKLARRKFRQHIFEAWSWRCAYCDQQLTEQTATIDHILPKHKGGHTVKTNMACSCAPCNRGKASTLLQDWYSEDNQHYSKERLDKLIQWTEQRPCSIKLSSTESAVPYISNDLYVGWVAT